MSCRWMAFVFSSRTRLMRFLIYRLELRQCHVEFWMFVEYWIILVCTAGRWLLGRTGLSDGVFFPVQGTSALKSSASAVLEVLRNRSLAGAFKRISGTSRYKPYKLFSRFHPTLLKRCAGKKTGFQSSSRAIRGKRLQSSSRAPRHAMKIGATAQAKEAAAAESG